MMMMRQSQLSLDSSQLMMLNRSQGMMMHQSHIVNQNLPPLLMNHHNQPMNVNQTQNQPVLMNQSQPGTNGNYELWTNKQVSKPTMDDMKYQASLQPTFGASRSSAMPGRNNNWKGKKGVNNRRGGGRRNGQTPKSIANLELKSVASGGCKPATLKELQSQNGVKALRLNPKKKLNYRFAPFAPRNTTSFIIRAKKSGGIASLVSPYPVTPAVLPTPIFSPSREVLGDMAKEEWGVDGYGSMKGLIRLRSPGYEADMHDEDEDEGGSGGSYVEEHVEFERRLDQDLSRFEMIYPSCEVVYNNILENRMDDQDTHIAQLEQENLALKERLFSMDTELGDLRRRLQYLEGHNREKDYGNEEVVENVLDNESESSAIGSFHSKCGQNNNEGKDVGVKGLNEEAGDVCMSELAIEPEEEEIADIHNSKIGEWGNCHSLV